MPPSPPPDDPTAPASRFEPTLRPADAEPVNESVDLEAPELYLNRELTWLAFNDRVLHEAADPRNPLLERLKFLAITASNVDEFFMKRIGGLRQQVLAGVRKPTADGRSPSEQILLCSEDVSETEARQREILSELREELLQHEIRIAEFDALELDDQKRLRDFYTDNVFPLVTPQTSDPAHPFPFVSNLSLNLLVTLRASAEDVSSLARVKIPVGSGIPRFVELDAGKTFVPLESLIAHNLDLLFPGAEIESVSLFRVTRNANTERNEEVADDLVELIETEMRDRRVAPIVRVEVSADMIDQHRGMVAAELGLDEHADVYEVSGMFALRDLMEIAQLPIAELHDPPFAPADHPLLARDERPIFHRIRETGGILLHHPYQSFATSVERFLREASDDPKVHAIKMTLYRTDAKSKVVDHLINAAENGKQVAVVVELKARFDEAANIGWANRLEEAGIHVTYGVVGLKTHCKVILVVRRDYDGLRRYAHIGTGNYNADTARMYADFGLLTCDPKIGQDVTELFNYLTTGLKPRRKYVKLLPSPKHAKPALLRKIRREIEHQREGRGGLIQFKCNALEDVEVTRALYEAASEGVEIDLLIRDSCRIRPGLPGLSETLRVTSIVGRFLEHTRIYYFRNGGEDEYYIGSADCMQRNLESRVEVLCPVEAPENRKELRVLLDAQLRDTRSAWDMHADGTYVQRQPEPPAKGEEEAEAEAEVRSSQQRSIDRAVRQQEKALRRRRRYPRARARNGS